MHLLYLDDAGSAPNRNEDYFVLGGLSVFEAQSHWLTGQLDSLAENIEPEKPRELEFHASEIFARRSPPWDRMKQEEARGLIKAVLGVLASAYETAQAFACAIHKPSYPGRDPVEMAFEDLCSRFDLYLARHRAKGDQQRGLIILDRSAHETSLQKLARDFRVLGTKWGTIRSLADTPLFVDSRASRAVQLADHVAYAVFRRYNAGDSQYFDLIASRFHTEDGITHGVAHKQTVDPRCMCPACLTRRMGSPRGF